MGGLRPTLLLLPLLVVLLVQRGCWSFELQDTIHALIEENIRLHDRLENLTQALRVLKRMLWHHTNGNIIYNITNYTLYRIINTEACS